MPLKTDLNVTPYYDDFDKGKNFQQVLSRPGYAVQARELTQMQSILKNQIETLGNFVLAEGTMVIPGSLKILRNVAGIKLETSFGGATIDVAQYVDETLLTGLTSGVTAKVMYRVAGTTTDAPTLYIKYISAGTDNTSTEFTAGESISADIGVTHGTTTFAANAASIQTAEAGTAINGSAAQLEEGVYWIRGNFVEVESQFIILEKYTNDANKRIGLTIAENIITPESDTTLLDNATGTSNYAAKGAHRLKIIATLSSLDKGSTDDSSFIELMSVVNGVAQYSPGIKLGGILDTLAKRTYDESGDYTVRPFTLEMKESVTLNENIGVYSKGDTTLSGGTASNDLLALKVSPGKAYIRGYDIEKITSSTIDIPKAREFKTVNSGVTTYDVGNYLNVTNVYGSPDISFISGETTPYKQIDLYDTETATRGSSSGTQIGVARTRAIEYSSGTAGDPTATFKLYLFDFRPFTTLTLSDTPSPTLEASHSNGGVQVKGKSSGATGWVWSDGTATTTVILTNVSGTFQAGEKFTSSSSEETDAIVENSGNTDLTITRAITKNVSEVRQVFMTDVDGGQNFSADVVLDALPTTESYVLLDGTDSTNANTEDHIISELDKIQVGLERGATGGTGSSLKQAKLKFAEKNISIFKMNNENVKTHLTAKNAGSSDTSYYLRKQYVTTSSSVGVVTISAGTNEVFNSHSEVDYMITILSSGTGGTGQQGDVVSAATGFSGGGSSTVTITNNVIFGNGAKLKITATLLKTSAVAKTKSAKLMKQMKVVSGTTDAYGTRPGDKTISLGRADAFKLVAVLDSEATGTDATTPVLTLGTITGNYTKGEEITGSSSGAKGRIIDTSSPMSFVYKRGTNVKFNTSDTITGFSSSATCSVSAVAAGSSNITQRYELDMGQRDNYYDISRIVRKPGMGSPLGRLLVVYDYLEHGTGDFFTVDSYVDSADQMTYEDIPKYSATKVDPDDPAPSGEYNLYEVFDIRPRAEDIAGTSTNLEVVDEITGKSFDFYHRQFDGTGASTINFIKPGSLITTDYEYYIGYKGLVHLTKLGEFEFIRGASSETPVFPQPNSETMQIARIIVPPYTFKPGDCDITKTKNKRFTMKDIGRLEERINHVEYYTSLTLLERDAESFQIQDANGLDRFKSGFVVDSFAGHSVGDVQHGDYKCSIDMQENELRPLSNTKAVSLIESVSTDSLRTSAGYQKTGDLLTLPYTEVPFQDQPYATRTERITPVLMSNWVGTIELDPEGDEWFETEYAPDLIVNVEGNFDTFSVNNASAVGTVWGAWSTSWGGIPAVGPQSQLRGGGVTRAVVTQRGSQNRTGVQTSIVPQIDLESQGTKVIQRAFIPYCRAKNITFTGNGFMPNLRLYAFFDGQNVNSLVTPLSGFTTDAADVSGVVQQESPLITTPSGKIKGLFALPDPKIEGNPVFRTGEVTFRLTSSTTNVITKDPETAGDATYQAVGILETEQETITATRNAKLQSVSVSQSAGVSRQLQRPLPRPLTPEPDSQNDPLAQTFFIDPDPDPDGTEESTGRFLTSIDLYFSHKDKALSAWVEIRPTGMEGGNGSAPGMRVMPFGRVVLEPDDILISDDASVATNVKFPSPIFLKVGFEYCVVIGSSTPEIKMWIARMGETEVGGSRTVSEQPHMGVLFKGHNNRTWAPSLTEDMKLIIYVAKFDTGSVGKITLNNDTLPTRTLISQPLTFTHGDTALLVDHLNHNMNDVDNNVTIAGVVSEAETTLSAAMTADATSLTLTSGSDFDDTTGKFAYDSSSQWWIKIDDEVMKYTTISTNAVSTVTRALDSTTAASHASGAKVELYMIHKVPFTEINKTHNALANINMDSYTVLLTSSPTITGDTTTATNGGSAVTATENAAYDTGYPIISTLNFPGTDVSSTIRPMTATSPSGVQNSFVTTAETDAINIDLDGSYDFDTPYLVASEINETLENAGSKSLIFDLSLSSLNSDVSPVVDLGRSTFVAISNRLNSIDSSADVYPTSIYDSSTDPLGDDNAAIYLTKKVTLENPATAIKVFFAGHRHYSSDIEVYYKILRSDDASEFDDLSYVAFNSDGSPDNAVKASTTKGNFTEYLYTAGVTDDGVGTPLDEFISFQIKIVMKGTNTAEPPRIKELRAIALAI